uniref:Uncharacterized protein n=1 Tax=Meloidogyne incognita TaxID=6306 RepID=A0A914L292_MELIC
MYPCPKCEEWCANLKNYTCNYNCHRMGKQNYLNNLFDLEFRLSYEQTHAENDNKETGQNKRHELHLLIEQLPEDEKKMKELCAEKETYNCTFETNDVYPLCALDFTPYDDDLKECCKLLSKCTAHNYPFANDPECYPVYGKIWMNEGGIDYFPRKNPKYWKWGNEDFLDGDGVYMGMRFCNL